MPSEAKPSPRKLSQIDDPNAAMTQLAKQLDTDKPASADGQASQLAGWEGEKVCFARSKASASKGAPTSLAVHPCASVLFSVRALPTDTTSHTLSLPPVPLPKG